MGKRNATDKNLQNVVEHLELEGVNAHNAQQLQQDINDRKNKSAVNHDHTKRP
jgi:hypothetical protein